MLSSEIDRNNAIVMFVNADAALALVIVGILLSSVGDVNDKTLWFTRLLSLEAGDTVAPLMRRIILSIRIGSHNSINLLSECPSK